MNEESKIWSKIVTKEEVEKELGCKIPENMDDKAVVMGGGDEPYASELAEFLEKNGIKVIRGKP